MNKQTTNIWSFVNLELNNNLKEVLFFVIRFPVDLHWSKFCKILFHKNFSLNSLLANSRFHFFIFVWTSFHTQSFFLCISLKIFILPLNKREISKLFPSSNKILQSINACLLFCISLSHFSSLQNYLPCITFSMTLKDVDDHGSLQLSVFCWSHHYLLF